MEGWNKRRISDVLVFEQPFKYIVKSSNYEKTGLPVLTPGKSFILGYTSEVQDACTNIPIILFDDFTTETKYVEFPFKVKSSALKILRTKDDLQDLRYWFLQLQMLKKRGVSSDHKRRWISEYAIKIVDVPLIKEQKKIADILSTVDKAIEHTEQLIAKYQRIKTGMMQDLLTNGIDDHGNIRSKKTHKYVVKNGVEVPEEWEVVRLEEICKLITDGSHFSPIPQKEGYPICNVKDMRGNSIDFSTCTLIKTEDYVLLKKQNCACVSNDILLSKDGTIGKVIHYKESTPLVLLSSIAILRLLNNYNPSFLKWILQSKYMDKQLKLFVSGSALKRLVLRDIKVMTFPFPKNKSEQDNIANRIDSLDQIISKYEAEFKKQNKLKTALMQDLLTGKVRVKV